MMVKCGINGEPKHAKDIFLCHHCGTPVCEEHGWVVGADDAFAGSPGAPAGPGVAATVPRPAMHCRDCADREHRPAAKRHGWAEPNPLLAARPGAAGRP